MSIDSTASNSKNKKPTKETEISEDDTNGDDHVHASSKDDEDDGEDSVIESGSLKSDFGKCLPPLMNDDLTLSVREEGRHTYLFRRW